MDEEKKKPGEETSGEGQYFDGVREKIALAVAKGDLTRLRTYKRVIEVTRDVYLERLTAIVKEINMYNAAIKEVEDKDQLPLEFDALV